MEIEAHGGKPYMYKSGHSLIKREMRDKKILFAGEGSGHMFFAEDYYGFDDALLAACRVVEIVSKARRPISGHFRGLPVFYSAPEIHIPCDDTLKFETADRIADYFASRFDTNRIDGARISFGDGWALIRASNTNPELVLRFEGHSAEALARIKRLVREGLGRYLPKETVDSHVPA
jgi:phosphomannomutase/phosphoglucomutase